MFENILMIFIILYNELGWWGGDKIDILEKKKKFYKLKVFFIICFRVKV